jgi:anaerobic magnesium-protoporphyrin IX monomethyl ester cyclase
MADILLTHGYFLHEDAKEQQIMKPYPPLGLLYLAAFLKRAGFSVDLYDSTLGNRAELKKHLAEASGGVLGIYTNLITRASVLDIAAYAKTQGWTVVLGGPEAANYPSEYLSNGADVVVFGEGEAALANLLTVLSHRDATRLHDVAGIAFRDGSGQVVTSPPQEQVADIDSLPWPERSMVDIPEYVNIWRKHHGMGSVNLITARGCPYKCRWCSHAVFGYSHRRRSHVDCAAEVEAIYETYHPDQVWYADDVFTINHAWLHAYAGELKRRNLKLPFETISRADRMMKDDVLETLAAMGCYRIWIGSESGSQKILDSMQRGVTVEQVQWATRAAQRHGIEVGMFLMWGYEGETEEDIAATVDHVKKANPDIFFTTLAYPIKNTPYFDSVADKVEMPGPWAEMTDRDYIVRGRPTRTAYQHADLWLRNEVAAARLDADNPTEAARLYSEAARERRLYQAAAGSTAP